MAERKARRLLRRLHEQRPAAEAPGAEEAQAGDEAGGAATAEEPGLLPPPLEASGQGGPGVARSPLGDEAIEEKTGNYLLSFGFPGSGKTTFQSFLAYYVTHIGPFDAHLRVSPQEDVQGWEPMALFNEWMRIWARGGFPPANPVDEDDAREMTFRIQPLRGVTTPLQLSLLELSGELMTPVVAERYSDPAMAEILGRYLANERLRTLLFLIVDPDCGEENDVLFQNLLTFLDLHYPDFRRRMSLAVLVSKPERALRHLQARDPRYEGCRALRGEACEAYVQRFAPRTYRILDGWPSQERVQMMALHIGEIAEEGGASRLREPDYADIHDIFAWIYEQLTGWRLGPTWWQRALEWLRP